MGLSDIDEDDDVPCTVPVRPVAQGQGVNNKPAHQAPTMEDLFGPSTCPPPAATQTTTLPTSGFDDFFGVPVTAPPPVNGAAAGATTTTTTPPYFAGGYHSPPTTSVTPLDPLDALFLSPTAENNGTAGSSGHGGGATMMMDAGKDMIFVDNTVDDTSNLLDLSKPAQRMQHQNLESCLDAFEHRNRGANARIGNAATSLEHLTRNHDDNKVKARLLHLLSYYDVLGVPRDAPLEDIKKRYKQLAISMHPDKTSGQQKTREEEDLFKAVTKAYEVLSDEEQRRKYDEELTWGTAAPLA